MEAMGYVQAGESVRSGVIGPDDIYVQRAGEGSGLALMRSVAHLTTYSLLCTQAVTTVQVRVSVGESVTNCMHSYRH